MKNNTHTPRELENRFSLPRVLLLEHQILFTLYSVSSLYKPQPSSSFILVIYISVFFKFIFTITIQGISGIGLVHRYLLPCVICSAIDLKLECGGEVESLKAYTINGYGKGLVKVTIHISI